MLISIFAKKKFGGTVVDNKQVKRSISVALCLLVFWGPAVDEQGALDSCKNFVGIAGR